MENRKQTLHYFLLFICLAATNNCTEKRLNWPCQPNGFLHFLYTSSTGSALRSVVTKPWLSKMAGWYCDTRMSRVHIKPFIKKHGIPLDEATRTNPRKYRSFNDFFTRTLKPEARPIDTTPNSIISPSDGTFFAFESIGPQTSLFVKDKPFELATFLKSKEGAQRFYGGTLIIIYLAPWDYHRFHFPVDATPSASKTIHGRYESVSPVVYASGIQPLQENERKLTLLKTDNDKSIAFVSVGALCVGRITHTYKPGTLYKKGHEAGYFSLGGSTIVLIFEKDMINLDKNILENQKAGKCTKVKMGQKIGFMKN